MLNYLYEKYPKAISVCLVLLTGAVGAAVIVNSCKGGTTHFSKNGLSISGKSKQEEPLQIEEKNRY